MTSRPVLLALMGLLLLAAAGCSDLNDLGSDSDANADSTRRPGMPPVGRGMATVESQGDVAATVRRLRSALQQNPAVSTVADIDYAEDATDGASDSLQQSQPSGSPARLVLFGNPRLGTPLMQNLQAAGLDLPQKMLVWKNSQGTTFVTYNLPAYLKARHELSGVEPTLTKMRSALTGLASTAAGRPVDSTAFSADSVAAGAGFVVETSDFAFDETYRRLKQAIRSQGLSIRAELDHARNARRAFGDTTQADSAGSGRDAPSDSAGLLAPTRLIVLNSSPPSMLRRAPTLGIDLPPKLLVYQRGEPPTAFVAYNDPAYLMRRHGLPADSSAMAPMTRMLQSLALQATTSEREAYERRETHTDTTEGIAY